MSLQTDLVKGHGFFRAGLPHTLVEASTDDVVEDGSGLGQFFRGRVEDLFKDVIYRTTRTSSVVAQGMTAKG